jgi:hypothetical protein
MVKHVSDITSPETQRRMRPIAIAAILLVFVAKLSQAQSQQRLEVFVGYSYAPNPLSAQGYTYCQGPPPCQLLLNYSGTADASGFEASAAFRFTSHWSAVADAGGTFGSTNLTNQYNVPEHDAEHLSTYLFGPQISMSGHIALFAQALFGAAHQSQSFSSPPYQSDLGPASETSFAAAFGGGLDIHLTRHLGVRAIQFREMFTRFKASTQYQPEVSAGVVFHLP